MLLPQLPVDIHGASVGTGKLLQELTDPMTMLVNRTLPPSKLSTMASN